MYRTLGEVTLRTGECLEAGIVRLPDPAWAGKLDAVLRGFEIGPWRQAFRTLLHRGVGAEVRVYILSRDENPLCTMTTVEDGGVGLRGNVWTLPAERRKGACSGLLKLQMDDFAARDGQALYLFTDYESVPYRLYRGAGFRSVEPRSGHMAYHATAEARFVERHFAQGETRVESLRWEHLPALHPLFMEGHDGLIRCAQLGLVGRWSPEWPLVGLLNEETERTARGSAPRSAVLRNVATGAVVGFAAWSPLARARSTCLVDLYCHPAFWSSAVMLLEELELPRADRCLAYADPGCERRHRALEQFGFRRTECLRQVPVDWLRPEMGTLPRTRTGAVLARAASPLWMALRRLRRRQSGTVNASPARTDLWLLEKRDR